MFVAFTAEPFPWQSDAQSWVFVRLPEDLAADVAELAADAAERAGQRRGFGSIRVDVRIGTTEWRTSLFPQAASPTAPRGYVLPLKAAVRKSAGVEIGRPVTLEIRLLDL